MSHLPRLFLSIFVFVSAHAVEASASVAELFATPENLQLVRSADKVDACILRHVEPVTRADGSVDRSTERYEETTFVSVPPDSVTSLRALLLNAKTYDWKAGNGGRRPQFYLRLRFHRGEEMINVDFCFMCHVLSLSHQGVEIGHANFSPNSDLFLQTFLNVFPNDEPLKHVAKETGVPL